MRVVVLLVFAAALLAVTAAAGTSSSSSSSATPCSSPPQQITITRSAHAPSSSSPSKKTWKSLSSYLSVGANTVQWLDARNTPLRCMDNYNHQHDPILASPGGDIGEFLTALSVYSLLGGSLPVDSTDHVANLVGRYFAKRPFVLPINEEAVRSAWFAAGVRLSAASKLDITSPPHELRKHLLSVLTRAEFISCAHLRQMLLRPSEFGVPAEFTRAFLELLWSTAWDSASAKSAKGNSPAQVTIDVQPVRGGDTPELDAVVTAYRAAPAKDDSSASDCPSPQWQPAIVLNQVNESHPDISSILVYSSGAASLHRQELAMFFATLPYSTGADVTYDRLLAEITNLADRQMRLSLAVMAPPRSDGDLVPYFDAVFSTAPVATDGDDGDDGDADDKSKSHKKHHDAGAVVGSTGAAIMWVGGLLTLLFVGFVIKSSKYEYQLGSDAGYQPLKFPSSNQSTPQATYSHFDR